MSRKRILESKALVGADGFQLEVKLTYDMGGYNYFTSEKVERGYKLSVTPVTIRKTVMDNGQEFQTRTSTAFVGNSYHLESKTRFTQSHFDKYEVCKDTKKMVIDHVLKVNNLKFK
jgi:hypothetical protein